MGTWDIGFFDNDMACDWENNIDDNSNISIIEKALIPVLENNEDSLDIDLANKALAAAEALARLLNHDGEQTTYTEHLDSWVKTFNGEISRNLIDMAMKCIVKITSMDSELKQYWTLRGEIDQWISNISSLEKRLVK